MSIGSRYLKRGLRSVWAAVQTGQQANPGLKLRDALCAMANSSLQMLPNGTLASNSSNGHSTTFAMYGAGQLTQLEVVEGWEYLVDEFDRAAAELAPVADDASIELRMEQNLSPCLGHTTNFMYLSK